MLPFTRIALSAILSIVLSGCAVHEGAGGGRKLDTAAYRIQVVRNQTFTPRDWPQRLQLDAYLPRGLGPFPAVLLVHGGAWSGGEREDMAGIARALAEKGYAAIAVSYRLAPRHRFPAQVHDLQQALRWLRGKSETYNIDPDRVAAFGYSSGAHLAALLGTISEGDALDQPFGGPETRVQAVVAGGTPADLRLLEAEEPVRMLIGGGLQDRPQNYEMASPVVHASSDDPPFFLYHGSWDRTIPIAQAEALQAALQEAGVPVEFYRIRGFGHAVTFLFDGDVVREAIAFLDRHLRRGI